MAGESDSGHGGFRRRRQCHTSSFKLQASGLRLQLELERNELTHKRFKLTSGDFAKHLSTLLTIYLTYHVPGASQEHCGNWRWWVDSFP